MLRNRLAEFTRVALRQGAILLGRSQIRGDAGLFKVGKGAIVITFAAERHATIDERAREVWIDLERLVEVRNGPFVALLFVPHQTALVVGASIREAQSDGMIKVDQRAIQLAMSTPQAPALAVQGWVIGVKADCYIVERQVPRGAFVLGMVLASRDRLAFRLRCDSKFCRVIRKLRCALGGQLILQVVR